MISHIFLPKIRDNGQHLCVCENMSVKYSQTFWSVSVCCFWIWFSGVGFCFVWELCWFQADTWENFFWGDLQCWDDPRLFVRVMFCERTLFVTENDISEIWKQYFRDVKKIFVELVRYYLENIGITTENCLFHPMAVDKYTVIFFYIHIILHVFQGYCATK